jgi:hypothetical protein
VSIAPSTSRAVKDTNGRPDTDKRVVVGRGSADNSDAARVKAAPAMTRLRSRTERDPVPAVADSALAAQLAKTLSRHATIRHISVLTRADTDGDGEHYEVRLCTGGTLDTQELIQRTSRALKRHGDHMESAPQITCETVADDWEGEITAIDQERFTNGDCHHLAAALHQLAGLQIVALPHYDHCFVLTGEGLAIDVDGLRPVNELLAQWDPEASATDLHHLTPEEVFEMWDTASNYDALTPARAHTVARILLAALPDDLRLV